ncbi:MAG TPA: Xaa-Pro peptidase family protein [Candidatus Bathyarchaeia archaeon]|nr:Xaa-Pro peptidase family protein [Candidatus Bathyarchaeia archaeon]
MQGRLERLRKALAEQEVDALITENKENRFYISGFTGSTGWAIITKDEAVFVTDFRYIDQATTEAPAFQVVDNERKALEAIGQQLQKLGVKRLAIEKNHISVGTFESWKEAFSTVELVPTSGLIENLRIYKDASELDIIKQAVKIADDAFAHVLNFIRPGVREIDVALELEFFMRKQGATGVGFDSIVASGVRGALPHGRASEKVIQAGEMVTLDFGAAYKGYNSDITRTVSVGEPSDKMREIYEIVLRAQLNCVNNIKPGMTGKEGDALTRDIIAAAGYGAAYGHSTGHGLGVEVHEQPNLSAVSHTVLQPGMLVTVEPGIYITDLGGVRIEDDVLITESGCEILTQSTKELLILPV